MSREARRIGQRVVKSVAAVFDARKTIFGKKFGEYVSFPIGSVDAPVGAGKIGEYVDSSQTGARKTLSVSPIGNGPKIA